MKHISSGVVGQAKIEGNWLTTPSTLAFPSHDSNVTNGVAGRWYSKLSGALAPFKGFVFLGELKGTCALIVDNARRIFTSFREVFRVVRNLRRTFRRALVKLRRWRRARYKVEFAALLRELLRRVSDLWLEWAFGVAPLLADIEAAAGILYEPKVEIKTVKATDRGTAKITSSTVTSGSLWLNCATYTVASTILQKTSCRAVGAIKCEKPGGPNPLLGSASEWGLAFREFLPTAWELTPWSFLSDYFINIGDILNAVAYHDVVPIYACISKRSTREWTCVAKPGKTGNVNGYAMIGSVEGGWMGSQTSIRFDRTKLSLSDVGFSVRYPPYAAQYINMLALLVSKLSKMRLAS